MDLFVGLVQIFSVKTSTKLKRTELVAHPVPFIFLNVTAGIF